MFAWKWNIASITTITCYVICPLAKHQHCDPAGGPPEPQLLLPLQAAAIGLSAAGLHVSRPEIWLATSVKEKSHGRAWELTYLLVWATGPLWGMWEAHVACGYWLALYFDFGLCQITTHFQMYYYSMNYTYYCLSKLYYNCKEIRIKIRRNKIIIWQIWHAVILLCTVHFKLILVM